MLKAKEYIILLSDQDYSRNKGCLERELTVTASFQTISHTQIDNPFKNLQIDEMEESTSAFLFTCSSTFPSSSSSLGED